MPNQVDGDTLPGFNPVAGRNYAALHLPAPITRKEIDLWSSLLQLSETQSAVLDSLFSDYLVRDRGTREIALQSLIGASERIGQAGPTVLHDVGLALDHANMIAECRQLTDRLKALEIGLISGIETFLSDEQLTFALRVRNWRERRRSVAVQPRWTASAADLSIVLEGLEWKERYSVEQVAVLDGLARQYEQSTSRIATDYAKAAFDFVQNSPLLVAQEHASADDAVKRDFSAQRRRLRRAQAFAERRLVQLNRTYLSLLSERLNAEDARTLAMRFGAVAYPEVFPNRFDMTETFVAAISVVETEHAKADVEMMRVQHTQAQDQLCKRMMDEVDDWMELVIDQDGRSPIMFGEFKEVMNHLQLSRAADFDRMAASLLAAIGESPKRDEFQASIDAQRIYALRRKAEEFGLSYRP